MNSHITTQNSSISLLPPRPRGLFRAFPALGYRNFRLFWSGQLLSLIGTWMQTTAQSWLVLELTHNSLALGTVGALQFLPILLFTMYGGVLADRLPKLRVLIGTQAASAVLAATLGVLVVTQTVQIWHIYILALLLGLTNALDMPTRQSFFGEMVGREALTSAVALNVSIFNMAKIVGPGIAGLMIARFGEGPLFIVNALSFIPVLVGLFLIDTDTLFLQRTDGQKKEKESTFKSLREGLIYIRQTPAIFLIITVIGIVSLFSINMNVVEPLIATDLLHQGAQGFGFISSSFGFGALIGALWIASGQKAGIKRMLICAASFCIGLILVGFSHWYVLSIGLAAITGFSMVSCTAAANSTLQRLAPAHLRGRVMGVYMLVFNGSTPIGNLLTGWLAGLIGITFTLLIEASLSLVAVITGWIQRGPAERDLLDYTQTYPCTVSSTSSVAE